MLPIDLTLTRIPSRNIHASVPLSPPTPLDAIPHVFVFPPEEERTENPPWCCFNPSDDRDSDYSDLEEHPSDLQFIDVALDFLNDHAGDDANIAPIFSRGSMDEAVEQAAVTRKAEKRSSSVLSFMSYRNDGEGRQHGARELPEDIVEVFKVRRNEGKQEVPPPIKRSKTLKMPFQKAFRSIKNVGKSSASRKPNVKDIRASIMAPPGSLAKQAPQEEIEPTLPPSRASSPVLTRRASQRLSKIFTKRNHSNVDLTTTASTFTSDSQSSSHCRETATPLVVDDLGVFISDPNQPERPLISSVSSKRSSKRFSVLDLHRVFAFSPSPPTPGEEDQDIPRPSQDAPSLPALSHDSASVPSTTSSESIHASPDVAFSDPLSYAVNNKVHWRTSAEMRRLSNPTGVPSDVNFEMRLDSLHFDSLSFDPEDFDVSMALDGQRRLLN